MSENFPYTFGKYQVESEIGHGGFGTVFRALDTELNRFVAIKILDPIYLRDRRWVARFRQEAQMMAKLDHPNIVPIYETGEEVGRLFLAMKLIEGPNLSHIIAEEGSLTWETTLEIICEIASALDYAHAQNIIHRDLKPGNIMINDGSALLSDFGLAKIVEDNSQSISMSGSFAGTYNYMAPEVFNNVDITPASDVYALGCVIYEMLMGHMLFDSKTPGEIVSAHIKGITIDEQLPDDSPDGTRRVLQTALAKEPEKRYQSAGELAQELLQLSTDRLAEPYVILKQAIAKHRWQEAVTIASEIRSQDPNYRDVESLEETALSEYRVGQRRYWSAQWQTSAEQALATENFDEARISITRWRHVAPDDPKLPLVERDLLLAERYVALQYLMAEEDWQAAQDKAAVIANQNPAYRNVLGLQARISANLEEPTPELGTKSTTEENATPPLSYTPTASQKSGSGVPAWIWWVVAIIVILIVIFVLYSLI